MGAIHAGHTWNSNIFNPDVQNTSISACNHHKKLLRYSTFFFQAKPLKSKGCFILIQTHHKWPLAPEVGSAGLGFVKQ